MEAGKPGGGFPRVDLQASAPAVGMAAAFELAVAERAETVERLVGLRRRLEAAVTSVDDVELTGHPEVRLPGLLSVIVRGVSGDGLVMALDLEDIACSTGSACTTGSTEPSHVLTAMGFPSGPRTTPAIVSPAESATVSVVVSPSAVLPT